MARAAPRGEPPGLAGLPPEPGPPPAPAVGAAAGRAPGAGAEELAAGPAGARALQPLRASPGPRRVLFADEALGLPLAQLRRYQPWGSAGLGAGRYGDDDDDAGYDDDADAAAAAAERGPSGAPPFYLLPAFVLPPAPGRLERLRGSMVELEDLLPPEAPGGPGRPPVLRGLIRVLNLSYHKAVHVRATHDGWLTFHDHPAHYVPAGSSSPEDGGQTDRFAFQLPFEAPGMGARVRDGARIDFVVRYQTPEATYWANNQGKNYTVVLKESRGPGPLGPPAVPRTKQLFWEVEAKQLKSCMKPGRHRQTEELRRDNVYDPVSSMECPADWDRGSGSIVVTPLPLQPRPQIIQVSDVMVASSPENKESHLYLPEKLLEYPQSPATEVHPSVLSLGAEEESLSSDLARPLAERFSEAYPVMCADLCGSDEAQSEDAVDRELEQLYLTHLSRLRAANASHGDLGGGPISDPDQELFLKWMGPERALNSSLAEEITLHYAMQSLQGVTELFEDAKESGDSGGEVEELGTSSGADEEDYEDFGEEETLKESPPGIVTGMWLAGQHPGFVLVKDGLTQNMEGEEILQSAHLWARSYAAVEHESEETEKECGQFSAVNAEGNDLLPNSNNQGAGLWEFPGQLHRALSQSLCVLGLLIFLPIVWNACMAFMGLAFYLSLAWFT